MPKRPLTPGDIIQVLWEDVTFCFDEDSAHSPAPCDTVGHLVESTKQHLILAGEASWDGADGTHRASWKIPRALIQKVTVLRRK